MRLYLKYLSVHVRSMMEYKTSFFLTMIGQALTTCFSFIAMYCLFDRFGGIKGYTFNQVLLCFSTICMSFSLGECFGRGFDSFSKIISNGEFDRIMVRPRSEILQVLGSRIELTRMGRLIQAIFILIYAIITCNIKWNFGKIVTLFLMIAAGTYLFFCLFKIYASFCFFTIEGLEFMNIFTDGGREIAAYPLDIYKNWVLKFFTYIVPLAFVNYYPFLFLIDKCGGNEVFYMLSPLLVFLFAIPSKILWYIGVRHYKSTGS
ncbi:ABC transporter permease [Inconstantimicrobium mannanitabidum]|uniref:Membrane protein n=1 Tax=Inconstantimicrobium mannanitabidum TaxID=1604901 RepID=A0ACB5RD89_9CLOT|nr:ABC-2 family transporter protein [Clostridium sp. TW13]GKX66767.1 membrane protein [Clostridium sp. TW13]